MLVVAEHSIATAESISVDREVQVVAHDYSRGGPRRRSNDVVASYQRAVASLTAEQLDAVRVRIARQGLQHDAVNVVVGDRAVDAAQHQAVLAAIRLAARDSAARRLLDPDHIDADAACIATTRCDNLAVLNDGIMALGVDAKYIVTVERALAVADSVASVAVPYEDEAVYAEILNGRIITRRVDASFDTIPSPAGARCSGAGNRCKSSTRSSGRSVRPAHVITGFGSM